MRFSERLIKYLPESCALAAVLACHVQLWFWSARRRQPLLRAGLTAILCLNLLLIASGFLLETPTLSRLMPISDATDWMRGVAIAWGICVSGTTIALAVAKRADAILLAPVDPGRRLFLRTSQTAVVAAPAVITGFGVFVNRRSIDGRGVSLVIPGLPRDLDGLRIAQVTDIHLSAFFSERDLAHAVGVANEFKPHLTVVTGDLITRRGDPLDACIRGLGELRAEAGVFGCLGNHEIYAECEAYTTREALKREVRFLRYQQEVLRFGKARLNLGGVDYERKGTEYLTKARSLVQPNALNVLLSHNPDVFRVAPRQGWDVTLSGHTHGGQVTVEYLEQHLNLARFYTPYVSGLYQEGNSQIYVSRGIGTVGVPARIGAYPEVALLTLCATSS